MTLPQIPPSPAEVGDLILQTREHVQSLGWGNREHLYPASQVRKAIAAAYAAGMDRAAQYRQAIDDELVTIESTVDTYPDARAAVRALIDWHVMVALDPAVSSDARALVHRGMDRAAEVCEAFSSYQARDCAAAIRAAKGET